MKLTDRGYYHSGDKPDKEQVKLAMKAISEMGLKKIKNINYSYSSYGMKHIVSSYLQEVMGVSNGYISNGAFIKAMIKSGFDVQIGLINARFNVGKREVKAARRKAEVVRQLKYS